MLINSRLFGFYMQQLTWMEIYDVVLHLTPKYFKKKKKKKKLSLKINNLGHME